MGASRPPRRRGARAWGPVLALTLLAAGCGGGEATIPAPPTAPAGLAAAAEPGPGTVTGSVRDVASGDPVAGAMVGAADRRATTDPDGRFRLVLPLGAHDLRVTAPEYMPATVVGVLAGLEPTDVQVPLPPLEVDALGRAAARARLESLGDGAVAAAAAEPPLHLASVTEVPATVRVLMPEGDIVEMPMDEYLRGVVPSEMGYVFRRDADALAAQAIAARTYAATSCLADSAGDPERCEPGVDANVDTTTRTQVWRPVHYDVTDVAVTSTHGQVVRAAGNLIHALYFARTRDRTLSSEDSPCCGGNAVAYLRSVASPDAFGARRGHGAGMSQEGAAVFADWGAGAEEILGHYYTGVAVDAPVPTPRATPEAAEDGGTEPPPVRAGQVTVAGAELQDAAGAADAANAIAIASTDALQAAFPFMALGVRWKGPPELEAVVGLEARTSHDGASWGPWQALAHDDDLRDQPAPGEVWSRLHLARGRFVQVRVLAPGASVRSEMVERVTVHYLDADEGPAAPAFAPSAIEAPVIPRSGWGADERLRFDGGGAEIWPPEYTVPRAQIVHHTVTGNDPADPAAVVRSIYHYHAVSRGWGDIGYNYLVDHRGNIYEGRFGGERSGRITQGGHALQYNANTIGVALLGTFTEAARRPSAAAEAALVTLLASRGVRYDMDPRAAVTLDGNRFPYGVLGHRDVLPGHTQCPGDGVDGRLGPIRDAVAWRMAQDVEPATATRRPPTATPRPPTATERPPTATQRPASPSPPPTTVPSPTPPPGCMGLLADGGFEEGSSAWILNRASRTGWDVYRGARALFVGLRDDEPDIGSTYASAMQVVRVPNVPGRAWLSFFARTEGRDDDRRLVRLLDAGGAVVALGDVSLPASSSWNAYRFDVTEALAPQRGRDVRLYLGVINNGDGRRSYVRFDDVALVVCPATAATASATATASVPTPTREATPAPTADPSGPRCGAVLDDGDFDTGAWRLSGDPVATVIVGPAGRELALGPAAGAPDAFGYSAAAAALRMPAGAVTASVSVRLMAPFASPEDTFVLELRRPADGARLRLLGPEDLAAPGTWVTRRAEWAAGAWGPDVELFAAVLNRGQGGPGGATALRLDDVRVDVCVGPSAETRYLPWGGTAGS